jgi:hypothetical protein
MRFDEPTDDRQSQPEPTRISGARAAGAYKPLEDSVALIGRYPGSSVDHSDRNLTVRGNLGSNADGCSGR